MGNENYDAFDTLMAKDWLNVLVDNLEQRRTMDILNSQIETIRTSNQIHIYSGIEILADVLGEELEELDNRNDEYREYSFSFRGVKIFQLSEERIGKYAGTN